MKARTPFKAATTHQPDDVAAQLQALEDALMVCDVGDVPDWPTGILANLHLDGWELVRRQS